MRIVLELKQWIQDRVKRSRERKANAVEITLKDRLEACGLLLTYIARKNIEIDLKDVTPKLVRARQADDTNQKLNEQEAVDFWSAYDLLTRKVAPVRGHAWVDDPLRTIGRPRCCSRSTTDGP